MLQNLSIMKTNSVSKDNSVIIQLNSDSVWFQFSDSVATKFFNYETNLISEDNIVIIQLILSLVKCWFNTVQ